VESVTSSTSPPEAIGTYCERWNRAVERLVEDRLLLAEYADALKPGTSD
jgi:hypothetical protein